MFIWSYISSCKFCSNSPRSLEDRIRWNLFLVLVAQRKISYNLYRAGMNISWDFMVCSIKLSVNLPAEKFEDAEVIYLWFLFNLYLSTGNFRKTELSSLMRKKERLSNNSFQRFQRWTYLKTVFLFVCHGPTIFTCSFAVLSSYGILLMDMKKKFYFSEWIRSSAGSYYFA